MEEKDVVYVAPARIGSVGIGMTSMEALKGIEKSGLRYKVFSRGYFKNVPLRKKNLVNYSFLEYMTYPFRFLSKYFGVKNNFKKIINLIFAWLIEKNVPRCKIYHTWINGSFGAMKKVKKNGAILIFEGANSHPLNIVRIMNEEYKKRGMKEYLVDENIIKREAEFYEDFDYVMCPSNFVYDSFLREGFPRKKLVKMPYGVDLKRFDPKKKYFKKVGKMRFVFVGSVQARKGIWYLLEAWKELGLENAELIVCGGIWPDAREIVSKCSDLKNVKFVGFVRPEDVLKDCDVFVSPSLEEGSALTCYEAMASGLPLIATWNTGSIVENGKEGFIIPAGDVEALKEKMKYFYENWRIIEKMGRAARKRVEGYSWENYGERLVGFYRRVLEKIFCDRLKRNLCLPK